MEEDGIRGDDTGPFDKETVEAERGHLMARKVRRPCF